MISDAKKNQAKFQIDSFLNDAVDQGVFPGVAVAAGNGNSLVYQGCFGHLSDRSSPVVSDQTCYDIASLTKVMATGTLYARLLSEGTLELDQPACQYLEEIEHPFTLRHLLSHSSGLPAWRPFYEKHLPMDREQIKKDYINWINQEKLETSPGRKAVYSDLGFILLGFILEEIYARPLNEVAKNQVFLPLGLNQTQYGPTSGLPVAPTQDCIFRKKIVQGEVDDLNSWALQGIAGHAGLFSTIGDVSRFAQIVLNNLKDDPKICSVPYFRKFIQRQKNPSQTTWALAWDTPSEKNSSSGQFWSKRGIGHLAFTGCSLWIDPEREFFVACLSNRVHPTATNDKIRKFRPQMHDLINQCFFPTME
jgi:CubicO group peptidase (beta-lactamase class C family)